MPFSQGEGMDGRSSTVSVDISSDHDGSSPPSFKERCSGLLVCLLFPFFALLIVWRITASEVCNDGLDCGGSIGAFFGAFTLGCVLCTFAIFMNNPEHRWYVPKTLNYPEGKGMVRDRSTGEPLEHRRGVHTPWHPHQQAAFMCVGTIIFLFSAVLWPVLDTSGGSGLYIVIAWSVLLGAGTLLVVYLVLYDPSDGIPVEQLNDATHKLKEAPSFDMYCFVCNKVYVNKFRYHCRRCNRCTTHFDHHCTFLNQCICGANYKQFFAVVTIVTLWLYYTLVLAVYWAVVVGVDDSCDVTRRARSSWGRGWFVTMLSILATVSLFGAAALSLLLHKHIFLVLANRKTGPDKFIATFGGFESEYEFDDQEMRRMTNRCAKILIAWSIGLRVIVNWKRNTEWKVARTSSSTLTSPDRSLSDKNRRGTVEWLLGDNTDGQSTLKSIHRPELDVRRTSRFFYPANEDLRQSSEHETITVPTMQSPEKFDATPEEKVSHSGQRDNVQSV